MNFGASFFCVLSKSIQIVAFDNPFPPDYGGAIDVFYKIKALSELGIDIDLHFFGYGDRKTIEPLREWCQNIYEYKRRMNGRLLFDAAPFIIKSRAIETLPIALSKNPAPILFEGIHTTAFLDHPLLQNHFKMVRPHNVEHEYYHGLAQNSTHFLKKLYFTSEARKLERYEPILKKAHLLLALSMKDATYFKRYQQTEFIPPFHQDYSECSETGNYILFHGNLGVEENSRALEVLVHHVFSEVNQPVVVAGKSPSSKVVKEIEKNKHIKLVANPDKTQMDKLIEGAKCHVFYTNQNTGVKLKLVHAIHTSGHIVLNNEMLFDPEFKNELEVVNGWTETIARLKACMETFPVRPRPRLRALFDNQANAEKIVSYLP